VKIVDFKAFSGTINH